MQDHLWKQQMRNALRTPREVADFFSLPLLAGSEMSSFKVFIPRSFAQLIKERGPGSPLWKQFIPDPVEKMDPAQIEGLWDPIGDKIHQKKGQIIHRYKNRILFLPTTLCPVTCRYCFRKNELEFPDSLFDADFPATLQYLRDHPEINEVIFSGGDPLILSDDKLEFYLKALGELGTIRYIRFHSRTPVILPARITPAFVLLLRKWKEAFQFKKILLVVHVNHEEELYPEVRQSLRLLVENQVEVLSQTVLLHQVNDSLEELLRLFTSLSDLGIKPYYLHHPDKVAGGMHFYLPLEKGRKLYGQLRNHLSGWAIPQYMVDIPQGEGKVWAYNPERLEFSGYLMNRMGVETVY